MKRRESLHNFIFHLVERCIPENESSDVTKPISNAEFFFLLFGSCIIVAFLYVVL
ncbi:MAG TPA: hypothetical protein PK595_01900 [Bacteroidota bacterium]|nr:hypothetical protein [Bacteroidota bacterium]